MNIKSLVIAFWTLCCAALATATTLHFGAPPAAHSQGTTLDEIALIINDEAITKQALAAEMAAERAFAPRNLPVTDRQLLDRIINRHLLAQLEKAHHITVSEKEINAGLARIAAQNHLSVAALLREVQKSTGQTEAQYRKNIRQQIALERLKEGFLSGEIHISDAQINDQIAQIARQQGSTVHVQDLLLPLPAGNPEQRAQKVKNLIATVANELRLQQQDLPAVAKRLPEARFRDFGDVNLGQIDPRFANALANTATGKVVDSPVVDDNGLHFLKVIEPTGDAHSYQVNEANVAHILLRTGDGRDDATQKARAMQLYAQLRAGEDFAHLARKYSEDPQTAAKGGELGWVSPEDMVGEFAHAMETQQLNTVYPPIKTPYGYHLLVVHARRASDKSKDLLRQKVRNALLARAVEDAWEQKLRALRAEAYIDLRGGAWK